MKKLLLSAMSFAALSLMALVAAADATVYSNTTNFLGSAFLNGGAAVVGTNTITRMVVDDIDPINVTAKQLVNFQFSVANLNATAVSARARVRFYQANGVGGAPGTFIAGATFSPISFNPGVTVFTAGSFGTFVVPFTKFWAGITYDNNNGATGATATQLNNLGVGLFNPPTIGTSADQLFRTTAAGDFLVNNPAGTTFNFGGAPVANAGWAFTTAVPEPGSASLICLGLVAMGLVRRRR